MKPNGAEEDRTPNLGIANAALSQLSYSPDLSGHLLHDRVEIQRFLLQRGLPQGIEMAENTSPVLVTGATGFIGRRLAQLLLERGQPLRLLARDPRRLGTLAVADLATVCKGDLLDNASLEPACQGCFAVINVAGAIAGRDQAAFDAVNAKGAADLYAAAERAGCRLFIQISSMAAVGPSPDGRELTEADSFAPLSAYGRSKRTCESMLLSKSSSCKVVVIRPPIVYGPSDTATLPLFKLGSRGFSLALSAPDPCYSIIYVDDLCQAILSALDCGASVAEGTYFATGESPTTLRAWGREICAAFGKEQRTLVVPRGLLTPVAAIASTFARLSGGTPFFSPDKAREALVSSWTCSSANLRKQTGWAPKVSLADGCASAATWYRSNDAL